MSAPEGSCATAQRLIDVIDRFLENSDSIPPKEFQQMLKGVRDGLATMRQGFNTDMDRLRALTPPRSAAGDEMAEVFDRASLRVQEAGIEVPPECDDAQTDAEALETLFKHVLALAVSGKVEAANNREGGGSVAPRTPVGRGKRKADDQEDPDRESQRVRTTNASSTWSASSLSEAEERAQQRVWEQNARRAGLVIEERDALKRQLKARESGAAELDAAKATITRLEQDLKDKSEALDAAGASVREATEALNKANAVREGLERELEAVRQRAGGSTADKERLEGELEGRKAALEKSETDLAGAKSRVTRLETELADAQTRIAALEDTLQEAERTRDRAVEQANELYRKKQAASNRADRLEHHLRVSGIQLPEDLPEA